MAVPPWRKGIITGVETMAPLTNRYWIRIPELEQFDFEPGQFVTFDLPIHERPGQRWRSYSIASWPDGSNQIELVIVLNQHGTGTSYIFQNFQPGFECVLRGPHGVFTLPPVLDKDLFLICTGTGVAPFRSMIHHIKNKTIPYKRIILVFGCRHKENLLYYQEFLDLTRELRNFEYVPVLSREEWDGRTGYVHSAYEELCAARQPAIFFLCGWKEMISEAKERILAMGYEKHHIHRELYG